MNIRLIAATAALALLATGPAFAQAGWNSQTMNGPIPQTQYQGTGANQGWNGTSQSYFQNGPIPQTQSDFYGPNGQSVHCNSQTLFANGPMPQTSTNCY